MATFTKGIDLYQAQKARLEARGNNVRLMHADIAEASYADAIELLSGTVPSSTLIGLGHPFARNPVAKKTGYGAGRMRGASVTELKRYGIRGSLSLLPINIQTSGLIAGIHLERIVEAFSMQTFELLSDAEYSKYILNDAGTVFMVGRGFQAEIRRRWKARNKALIDVIRGI